MKQRSNPNLKVRMIATLISFANKNAIPPDAIIGSTAN